MDWLTGLLKGIGELFLAIIRQPSKPPTPPPVPPPTTQIPELSAALLELHNAERAKAGLGPLRYDSRLSLAAQANSDACAASGRLTHSAGGNPGNRITGAGYVWTNYGENIASGYKTPQAAVAGWMASTHGHRENILGRYADVGFGHTKTGRTDYWTTCFATERAARVPMFIGRVQKPPITVSIPPPLDARD